MGDYVLESNPALDRLIERIRAQGEPLPPEPCSSSNGHGKRPKRKKRSKVRLADQPDVSRGVSAAEVPKDPSERATISEPVAMGEAEWAVVEDDPRGIHEDPQASDEMVLVDFDEEPALFDDDPDFDVEKDDDEPDEILDIYEDEESDDGRIVHSLRELVDESIEVPDENRDEAVDWIFDAFEAWKLDIEDQALHEDEDLEALDENESDADDFIDLFDEDTEDPIEVGNSPYGESEVTILPAKGRP